MNAKTITLYKASGEIIATIIGCMADEIEANLAGNEAHGWIEGQYSGKEYWVDRDKSAAVKKMTLEPLLSHQGLLATLSGLPPGCEIACQGQTETTLDGRCEISFDVPGTYEVRLKLYPQYHEKIIKVEIQ